MQQTKLVTCYQPVTALNSASVPLTVSDLADLLWVCLSASVLNVFQVFPLLSVSIHMIHEGSVLTAGSGYYGPKVCLVFTEQWVSRGWWVKTLFCQTVCNSEIHQYQV